MNIFILDSDYTKIPAMMIDAHIVKMPIETAQLLCSVHEFAPYKRTHYNHPCAIWTRASLENYLWLCKLGLEICKEYTYRYDGKIHKSQAVIEWCMKNLPKTFNNFGFSEPPQCMPDEYKHENIIQAYRKYYVNSKKLNKSGRNMHCWTKRIKPKWC